MVDPTRLATLGMEARGARFRDFSGGGAHASQF